MSEKPRVAFKIGSVKRPVLNNVVTQASQFDSPTNNHEQPELVTVLDNGEIKSSTPSLTKKELIIPVQPNTHQKFSKLETNRHQSALSNTTTSSSNDSVYQLHEDAKRAIILEAQQANVSWNERHENETIRVHTIEQDFVNGFMNTSQGIASATEEEEEENHIQDADYDQVPIEEFGMAVLRGMGYEEDAGLGKSNKRKINVFVPETRSRGLGLGADRKILEELNKLKHNLKESGINENDDLCLEKGAFVLIQQGAYRNSYGTIDSIEEDLARLNIILAINDTNDKKQTISVSQYNVKLVTEKEFLKYSGYVNKRKETV